MRRPGLTLRLRACRHCGGAAYLEKADEDEWRCLQCARPSRRRNKAAAQADPAAA